jgi:hypothetical protein
MDKDTDIVPEGSPDRGQEGAVGQKPGGWAWTLPASLVLHAVLVAALFLDLSPKPPEPKPEEAVSVQLVNPEPEQKKAEAEKPPEPEEKPPEPEKKPPEPEQKPPEAEKPPPPPPEPKPEQQEPEPPSTEEPSAAQKAEGVAMPVLRPVFAFGDKDAGPKISTEGDAATGDAKPAPELLEPEAAAPKPTEVPPEAAPKDDKPPGIAAPEIDLPKADLGGDGMKPGNPSAEAVPKPEMPQPNPEKPQETPASEPAKTETKEEAPKLTQARTLFSTRELQGAAAQTAMAGIPRDVRASQLCATELREQLRHASPPYQPFMLPAYRLPKGTVLDIKTGAFKTRTQWFNLSFRCEIDADATKVVSFAFSVGEPVPKSEWKARRFPE